MPTGVYQHRKRVTVKRYCYACGKGTYSNDGLEYWRLNKPTSLVICNSCDAIIWRNKSTNPRRLTYGRNQIYLWKNVRTGSCNKCNRSIGKGIKRTNMHHEIYIPIIPWYGLVELCVSCHRKLGNTSMS